jgi:CBS domain-containing protein
MKTISKPFPLLTADDLMTRPAEVISQDTSLRAAAHFLSQGQISGAPVVDATGRCVGVLSATDFVHWAENNSPAREVVRGRPPCVCSDWQLVEPEYVPQDAVRRYMAADPVTAAPDTSITELARMMRDAHIHRVIVVDDFGQPVGVVTSTDILAAVARTDEDSLGDGPGCLHGAGRG